MNNDNLHILLVDDEHQITSALTRVLRRDYQITTCNSSLQAKELITQHQYALIISDMRMPDIDGAQLLAYAKQHSPKTTRILMTGFSDLNRITHAVEEGDIFGYISKPWNRSELLLTIKSACEHYILNQRLTAVNELISAQQQSTYQTENSKSSQSIIQAGQKQRTLFKKLVDALNVISNQPVASDSLPQQQIAVQSKLMAEALHLEKCQSSYIYLAALMANIDKLVFNKKWLAQYEELLSPEQLTHFQQTKRTAMATIDKLPLLTPVAEIIKQQHQTYAGHGGPDQLSGEQIPIGARILRIVKDYNQLINTAPDTDISRQAMARQYLTEDAGRLYDPQLVTVFLHLLDEQPSQPSSSNELGIASKRLTMGNTLSRDVHDQNQQLFLAKDTVVCEQVIEKIRAYEHHNDQTFTFYIY